MKIKLFLNRDINSNANFYFEKAKKLKKKNPGLLKAIEITKKEISDFEEKKEKYLAKKKKDEIIKHHKKQQWYEKFRWTKTSSNLLLVIGKDASTNEILIKKNMEENDLVFHTEEPGSPFGLLKNAKNNFNDNDIVESASFIACFSKQWKRGFGTADAFWVEPHQISKKAESGEYISKGSFMIRGNKNIIKNIPLKIGFGVIKTKIEDIEYFEQFSGSFEACQKLCTRFVKIEPGQESYKKLNKELKKKLKLNSIDDLPHFLPNGCRILKR